MFRAIFLGVRTWMVQTERHTVLVDPLFGGQFATRGGARGFHVHPPRNIDLTYLPQPSAVVLTSERAMHFDLPSILSLPRSVAVYAAADVSAAATAVLDELGFEVHGLEPGADVQVGDMKLGLALATSAWRSRHPDVDAGALVIRHGSGPGHLHLPITGRGDATMWREEWPVVDRPGIWAFDVGFNKSWGMTWTTPNPTARAATLREFLTEHEELSRYWRSPRAYVTGGPGFAHDGALTPLNRSAFPVDPSSLCRVLDESLPGTVVRHLLPGMGLSITSEGGLGETQAPAGLVNVAPEHEWPTTKPVDGEPKLRDFPPFSGSASFDEDDFERLLSALETLARSFAVLGIARDLLGLGQGELGAKRRSIALVLRVGTQGGVMVLEYDPRSCCFDDADSGAPLADYPAGLELWASDLLAALSGRCNAEFMDRGHSRSWNALPSRLRWCLAEIVQHLCQPLVLPEAHLDSYRVQAGLVSEQALREGASFRIDEQV